MPRDLPIESGWEDEDTYVTSLLSFTTSSNIFRNLCGGVHVLDFLTREPDLYTAVLPEDWRAWFEHVDVENVLEFLLREDLDDFALISQNDQPKQNVEQDHPRPPRSLIRYVENVRKHCLLRQFAPISDDIKAIPRPIAVGMKPKKMHEVSNLALYVDTLSKNLRESAGVHISGIVDFGSGQNYLGRTLMSPPYNQHVIAIERKHHNIDGAKGMDVYAKLAKKQKVMRNKKEYKQQVLLEKAGRVDGVEPGQPPCQVSADVVVEANGLDGPFTKGKGSMTYIEHDIQDGRLESILFPGSHAESDTFASLNSDSSTATTSSSGSEHENPTSDHTSQVEDTKTPSSLIVVSLHSCGNLVHHGLRSLVLNPSVVAVAMIGCCYNLMTERLGPPTYKLPSLRSLHPRLESTSTTFDPHGFPMSEKMGKFEHKHGHGVRLNITARMMAVQAPYNWGSEDSKAFFTRHFYRALLQRILLDRGVVKQSKDPDSIVVGSISGRDAQGTPLVVGSLRKQCFISFRAYVRGAISKLANDAENGAMIRERTSDLTDEVIDQYEADWGYARKNLSVIWSLMAFSAGVVESVIAVDRWLFLKEQNCVERCWVEPVFEYAQSPRNLVVVGIKKTSATGSSRQHNGLRQDEMTP